jgi:hypothetical protein
MKPDHEAAKKYAISLQTGFAALFDRNLAACYLDSVPKKQYDRLRELAKAHLDAMCGELDKKV